MFRSCEFMSPWLDVDASGRRTRDLYYDLRTMHLVPARPEARRVVYATIAPSRDFALSRPRPRRRQ